jgi:hypothetical protein
LPRVDDWDLPDMHGVPGLHRHVVRLIELGDVSYVVKELPDDLAMREYRLLRELAEDGLPTAEVVAVVTGKPDGADGMLVTRHLDYALPYRSLLSGRGLTIPYLGERLLDALVGLLVRLHLAGFYWGDCSLSNTLFRRDAGALSAYVIDVETGERYPASATASAASTCRSPPRTWPAGCSTSRPAAGSTPTSTRGRCRRHRGAVRATVGRAHEPDEFDANEMFRLEQRLERLHELGFDVEEMEIVSTGDGQQMRFVPRVVEHGYHAERLRALTGLVTGENQARRLLNDIRGFGAELQDRTGTGPPENVVPCGGSTSASSRRRRDPGRAAVQARGRRDLPPGARAPLVPVGGGRRRHPLEKARSRVVHRGRAGRRARRAGAPPRAHRRDPASDGSGRATTPDSPGSRRDVGATPSTTCRP